MTKVTYLLGAGASAEALPLAKTVSGSQMQDAARKISMGSEFLVVIGYSFPFFNRNIDRQLLENLLLSVRKIYFQDPYLDGSFLRAQFGVGGNVAIEHIKDTNQFFLPHEL
ncbi:hypothetical protein BH11BAC7_BH11BAC7_17550 [soil metagenome]